MIGVTVQLGPLVGVDRVFYCQLVKPEFVADQRKFVSVGRDQVNPDHGSWFREVFGELIGIEVGVGQDTVHVAAGADHTETVPGDADATRKRWSVSVMDPLLGA
jgi:hypothetical protein